MFGIGGRNEMESVAGIVWNTHSGARASEIAQLDVADIISVNDIWCFEFRNADNESDDKFKKVKTDNGERIVPIHSVLLQLGFLEYVESVEAVKLFPQEKPDAGKYGKRLSADFSTFRKDIYPKGNHVTLHGFRHSHATKLSRFGYDEKLISQLQGRERGISTTVQHYIKDDEIHILSQAIESIIYKGEQYGDVLVNVQHWSLVEPKITFERVNAKFKHDKKKGGIRTPAKKNTTKTTPKNQNATFDSSVDTSSITKVFGKSLKRSRKA